MWKNPLSRTAPVPVPPPVLTLKGRVTAFWNWYREAAERFHAEIENKRCAGLQPEVSAKVDELLPGMAWGFGPGEGDTGHSFTLTPEGNPHQRFIAQYWLQQAPDLANWTFHAARQASELHRSGRSIEIDSMEFGPHEIWLTPQVDEQAEKVDITVWHPLFDRISERLRYTVTFLWLDEALGEDGVVNWIGRIRFANDELDRSLPLSELPEFIADLQAKHRWDKLPPHQVFSGYTMNDPEPGGLRRDIVAGTTRHLTIVNDYPLKSNPLERYGADYLMVAFPASTLPRGAEVEQRGAIEDLITQALEAEASGVVLGGAMGLDNAYIDLLLYDGENSKKLVRRVLAQTPMAGTCRLLPFVVP